MSHRDKRNQRKARPATTEQNISMDRRGKQTVRGRNIKKQNKNNGTGLD